MSEGTKEQGGYLLEAAYVVFKRKWLILTILVVVLVGVCLRIATTRSQYEATAVLLVKNNRGELLLSPGQGTAVTRASLDQDVASEVELVRRSSLLADVVQVVGSDAVLSGVVPAGIGVEKGRQEAAVESAPPSDLAIQLTSGLRTVMRVVQPVQNAHARITGLLMTPERLAANERAVLALERALTVVPIFNSGVIKVSFAAENPRFAGSMLDLLVQKYLEKYTSLRSGPGAADFFERQKRHFHSELERVEAARQYLEEGGKGPIPSSAQDLIRVKLDRESALLITRSEVEELREKGRALRERVERLDERVPSAEEHRANPVTAVMRTRLFDLETERTKLLQKFTEQDRRVKDIEREIEAVRARYLNEPKMEVAVQSSVTNPLSNPLMVDLVNTEMNLLRSEIKAKNLEREVDATHAELKQAHATSYDRIRLERASKVLEEAYLLYTRKHEEARIARAMDENHFVNVVLADPVRVAPQQGRRSPLQLAFLGGVVGLVAGVACAFGREYMNPALGTAEGAQRHLRLPVLASVREERA